MSGGGIFKSCKFCGEPIVLVPDYNNKYKPVNTSTYHGEELYDRKIHQIHFRTCPEKIKEEDVKAMKKGY